MSFAESQIMYPSTNAEQSLATIVRYKISHEKKKTKALKYFTFKQITFPSLHSLFSNESFKTQLDSEVAGCCGAPQRVKLEVVRDCA